ncbi:MAG: methyl-accepting chemotaxis protein [Treponemataceae bacterium]|nr:methyl-accepting chemotaxis protein [Treponemataceae bacterium]
MDHEQLASNVTENIRRLVTDSEQVFLSLGKKAPVFVKEMEKSLVVIRGSLENICNGESFEAAIDTLFNKVKEVYTTTGEDLKKVNAKSTVLYQQLQRAVNHLTNLGEKIEHIKYDADEMELVSINALTGAIKSGVAGKGFAVITDELRRITEHTLETTRHIMQESSTTLQYLSVYNQKIQNMDRLQAELFVGLDQKIETLFFSLREPIFSISNKMKTLIEEAEKIRGPVLATMEAVQEQDILRQSLEHVFLLMQEYVQISQTNEFEQRDIHIFQQRCLSIANSIVEDVEHRISRCIEVFRKSREAIEQILQIGEKIRSEIVRQDLSQGEQGGVVNTLKEIYLLIEKLGNQLELFIRERQQLVSMGGQILFRLSTLLTYFKKQDRLVERLKTVDMAARIEIAKYPILRSIKNTIISMSELIEIISCDLSEAHGSIDSFTQTTNKEITDFVQNFEGESKLLWSAKAQLENLYHELKCFSDTLIESVRHFSLFSPEFLAVTQNQKKDLKDLSLLEKKVQDLKHYLASNIVESDHTLGMKDSGEMQELHSQRLREIIERFTIFAHKQVAHELAGPKTPLLNEEEVMTVEEGSITFFE